MKSGGIALTIALPICLLAFAWPAHADETNDFAAQNKSLLNLIEDMAGIFDKMKIPLKLDPQEITAMFTSAKELVDPQTTRTFRSPQGRPLPYYVFEPAPGTGCTGSPAKENVRTVLFIGGCHPQEASPLFSSWKLLAQMLRSGGTSPFANTKIIYVPILNPDGAIGSFARRGQTARETMQGADLNRDFHSKDPQNETRFVMELINAHKPSHIVSLHGPYGWLDYDGPAMEKNADLEQARQIEQWLNRVQAKAPQLRIKSQYPAHKGSLGDYAGKLRGLHVLTYEYPTWFSETAESDWAKFGESVLETLNPAGERKIEPVPQNKKTMFAR